VTHGRLRQPKPASRSPDVQLTQESVEGNQEVEINRSEIHMVNLHDSMNPLDESIASGNADRMETQNNKEMVTHIMNALAKGDRAPFADAMADDFAWIFANGGVWSGTWRGKERVRRDLLASLFAQFEGIYTSTPVRILADGDFVVVECRGHVTTKRGDLYDNSYCYVIRLEGGKMKELTEYMDTALAERVLHGPARE
jgi:ketosteroid isomerase-like protein